MRTIQVLISSKWLNFQRGKDGPDNGRRSSHRNELHGQGAEAWKGEVSSPKICFYPSNTPNIHPNIHQILQIFIQISITYSSKYSKYTSVYQIYSSFTTDQIRIQILYKLWSGFSSSTTLSGGWAMPSRRLPSTVPGLGLNHMLTRWYLAGILHRRRGSNVLWGVC